MSPKPRSPRPSNPGPTSRPPRRASVFVNQSALERWLTGSPPSARNTAEVPLTQPDTDEDDEEPQTERGTKTGLGKGLRMAS
ncbi:MAG TPA: hypothetical protein DFS52_24765 [Myxococcales bacterium]|jgi:hypothetical protein|nr:hypothetical protein [Myxococcales bacterium]